MRTVEASALIHRPPQNVLDAFTDARHLQAWWGVERSLIELKSGGTYALAWKISPAGFGFVASGIVGEYLPACQLRIDHYTYFNPEKAILGPMQLHILTTPENGGTLLTVVQSGYRQGADWDWYQDAVKATWPAVVLRIKAYLEKL